MRKVRRASAPCRCNLSAQIRARKFPATEELSGKINYLTGNDPAQWRSGVPTFAKVRVEGIYPGVNLVYYGNQQQLEYDFTIAPDANPGFDCDPFRRRGQNFRQRAGRTGFESLGNGEIRQPAPVIYQTVDGARKEISGGYKILDANTVAFAIGNYDHNLPLVIDPILSYSTYFGGTSGETAWAVAVNQTDGSIYIAGQTFSKLFINKRSAIFHTRRFSNKLCGRQAGGRCICGEVRQLRQNLLYLTYLGGKGDDAAYGIAVDSAGDALSRVPLILRIFPFHKRHRQRSVSGANISGVLDKNVGAFPTDAFVSRI